MEPGEIYFEDFAVFYFPPGLSEHEAIRRKQKGRLKLCSRSLVFDPTDVGIPVLKFPLSDCKVIDKWKGSLMSKLDAKGSVIMVECEQTVEMLKDNRISPYTVKKEWQTHLFSLVYANVEDCLPQMCQLHRASTLPAAEQASMIAVIVHSRQARVKFNACWLENLHEEIVLETQGNRITPLVTNPGRIMLTSSILYFQPYNNAEPFPVLKVKLSNVRRVVKRRFLLRQIGLEVFCSEQSSLPYLFLSLRNRDERNELYDKLLQQNALRLENAEPENMTLLWQNGVISNYDYLLYLNSVADRSFNDLTQYPVFPWVISDYKSSSLDLSNPNVYRDLSKPIGALNEERLHRLKERYDEMVEQKFLYGSHYSTPGFVLYYIVRKVPQYMLCLQNGRFDHPDRMFNSMFDTWKNVTVNTADFKEMVPEFYEVEDQGDFLVNSLGLDFGMRQDGTHVGDVELPKWADGPADFIQKLRNALESSHVSNTLHNWIDLMFGYKQKGVEAEKANNVFYYMTYEGAVDLDSIEDVNERYAMEVQIMEFGQVPTQIFHQPHPRRTCCQLPRDEEFLTSQSSLDEDSNLVRSFESREERLRTNSMEMPWSRMESLTIETTYTGHKDTVTAVRFSPDGKQLFSASLDGLLKVYSVDEKRQLRSIGISNMALSSMTMMPDGKTVIVGSWDNSVYTYNVEYGTTVLTTFAHDDAVSDVCWNKNLMLTSSWDSTVKVWTYLPDSGSRKSNTAKLVMSLDHDTKVNCVQLSLDNSLLLSGTDDGQVYLWDVNTYTLLTQIPASGCGVHGVAFTPDGSRFICCGDSLQMYDINTQTRLFHKDAGEEIRCLRWDGFTVLTGGTSGQLFVWDLLNGQLLKTLPGHSGPLTSIDVYDDGNLVATGSRDKSVILWKRPL